MKRITDLVITILGAPFAAPVMLVCMAAIKLTSSGPVLFKQTRVGRHEKLFTCYKLRTMYIDTPDAPSHEVSASSVTPVGHWLRRVKLDEVPQLWNIIRGEMSFVGPRPCLPTQVELIDERRKRGINSLRPGITGVSQIAGIDMSNPVRLAESDATYIGKISLLGDLKIIIQTATGFGRGDAVK